MYWISKSIHWLNRLKRRRIDSAGRAGPRHHHDGGRQRRRRHFHLCPNRRQDGLQTALGLHHPRADGLLRPGDDRPAGRGDQARPRRSHLRRLWPFLGLVLDLRPGTDQLADAGDRVHRHDAGDANICHSRMGHLPRRHVVDVRHRDVGPVLDVREADPVLLPVQPGVHSGGHLGHADRQRGRGLGRRRPRVLLPGVQVARGLHLGHADHADYGQHRHHDHPLADFLPAVARWSTRGWTSATSASARSTRFSGRC